MRLGLNLGMFPPDGGRYPHLAALAEECGYDSIWTAEGYGSDAFVPLTWLAAHTKRVSLGTAIAQMHARTPANLAMTVATLDHLSNGRVLLGLGVSGPQVVEGWHGLPYRRPLEKTREYVEIVRRAVAREDRLEFSGEQHQIPYVGDDATGLGKPLKLIMHPLRPRIPIYLAALGPKNLALTARIADGWLPVFYSPRHHARLFAPTLADAGPGFDVAPTVQVVVGNDLEACRDKVRATLALYIGGMGARGRNFYFDLADRYGYASEAERIQELHLRGDKQAAADAVPAELIDEVALCGPAGRIRELWTDRWRDSAATHLLVSTDDDDAIRLVADLREQG